MINIRINECPLEIDNHFNVLQLLEKVNAPTDGVALAINNYIIPKSIWHSQFLSENDKVLIIQATQGG